MSKFTKMAIATSLIVPTLIPLQHAAAEDEDVVKLRFLETTDLHTNITNYDYFQDKIDNTIGLTKVATLIQQHRTDAGKPNTFLFDNGDTLQGTPFGDYVREQHQKAPGTFEHPMYEAMSALEFDAVTLGNHEFNFGLQFLYDAMQGFERQASLRQLEREGLVGRADRLEIQRGRTRSPNHRTSSRRRGR
ncbi:metallophosphoesterase [Exiguobacterium mexicanum]|uniref:metallophosphoesterase n=1 Tax=Exiguobacterium mexicanum TaxID=340146 RepID=UPI0037C16E65